MMPRSELPVGSEKTALVREMFDGIAKRYELVNTLMTFGLDRRWRTRTITDLRLPASSVVVDFAAGTGDLSRDLERAGMIAVPIDLSFGMLRASKNISRRVQTDAARVPLATASADGVTCGYALRNFTELQQVFNEMARVTKPGGRLSILEVAEPRSGLLRIGFNLWFRRIVPLVGGLVSSRSAYSYLPKSTAYLPDTNTLCRMIEVAGYSGVNHRFVMGGLSQQFTATRTS